MLYWIILIVCCIPLYLAIAWAFFDTRENARDSFVETIITLVKAIFIPRIVRVMLGMEEENALGLAWVGLFVAGCIGLTWAVHLRVQRVMG